MKKFSMLFLIALFLLITGFQTTDKKEKKARQQLEMTQLIQSGRFKFIPNSASSSVGNILNIKSGYEMVFDSLNIEANLPYYGRSYASYYRLNSGVKFELKALKIDKTWNERKKTFTIDFNLSEKIDSYSINLTVGLDGFAKLKITFFDHELTSYYGIIEKTDSFHK